MSRPEIDAMTLLAEANARNCVCGPYRDAGPDQVPVRGRTACSGSRMKHQVFALRSTLSPELRAFGAALVTLLVSILSTFVLATTDLPACRQNGTIGDSPMATPGTTQHCNPWHVAVLTWFADLLRPRLSLHDLDDRMRADMGLTRAEMPSVEAEFTGRAAPARLCVVLLAEPSRC